MEILVITEEDLEDKESSVIGVAHSVDEAKCLIEEYYGYSKTDSYRDIQDSGLEFEMTLTVKDDLGTQKYKVWTEWHTLNKLF